MTYIRDNNLDYEASAKKISPPVSRGLVAWHLLNTSLPKARNNYAWDGADSGSSGSPIVSANHIQLTNANRFDLPIYDSAELTICSVWDEVGTTGVTANIAGRQQSGSLPNSLIYTASGSNGLRNVSFNSSHMVAGAVNATAVNMTGVDMSVPRFIAAVASNSAKNKLYDMTANRTVQYTAAHDERVVDQAGNFQLGGGAFTGLSRQYFCAIFQAALTEEEIREVYMWAKRYFAGRGVTI